jgi:hypothetical protein
MSNNDDPLPPHIHDPNLHPPSTNPDFVVVRPGSAPRLITVQYLHTLPQTRIGQCYIVSTGHGTSGPFRFQGVTLKGLLTALLPAGFDYTRVEARSGDGFSTRISAAEIHLETDRPILLATGRDGLPLRRDQGLVRLIVPQETDGALRQVKWIANLTIRA